MNLLDEHLLALYKKGINSYEVAAGRAQQLDEFRVAARQLGLEDAPKEEPEEEVKPR